MGKPHVHAELIKAWADGAEIEYRMESKGSWLPSNNNIGWYPCYEYRIKPERKPDYVDLHYVEWRGEGTWFRKDLLANLKLTFDGETGKLKSAEVL